MNSLTILCIIYSLTFILFGGFYDFSLALIGLLLIVFLLFGKKLSAGVPARTGNNGSAANKSLSADKSLTAYGFGFLAVCAILSKHAVSSSIYMSLLQIAVPFLFFLCVFQNDLSRQKIFTLTVNLGITMTLLGGFAFLTGFLKSLFFQADRFGGFFQYSGTCALFLIVCAMIEFANGSSSQKLFKKELSAPFSVIIFVIKELILCLGILMTGSRGPLLLFILYVIIFEIFFHKKECDLNTTASSCNTNGRLWFGVCALVVLVLAILIPLALGSKAPAQNPGIELPTQNPGINLPTQNLGRIFTLFSNSSTIWGRILYHLDGLRCLIANPFGLGHLGYYYLQGTFQTGVYTTRFVHDDILQCGLDYGIVPMIGLIAFFAYQLIKGQQSALQKKIMGMILLCSLIDFNLQYPVIVFLLILCLDCDLALPNFVEKNLKSGSAAKRTKEFSKSGSAAKRTKEFSKSGSAAKRSKNFSYIKGLEKISTEKVLCFVSALAFLYFLLPFSAHHFAAYSAAPTAMEQFAFDLLPSYTDSAEAILETTTDANEAKYLCESILKYNPYSQAALGSEVYLAKMNGDEAAMTEYMAKNYRLHPYDMDLYQSYIDLAGENADAKNRLSLLLEETKARTGFIAYKLRDVPFETPE